MKNIVFFYLVCLLLISCTNKKVDNTITNQTQTNSSSNISETENTTDLYSRNFTEFFKLYDDENYNEFIELLNKYEKEDKTGEFSADKLSMRIHAETEIYSAYTSDELSQYLSKYLNRKYYFVGKYDLIESNSNNNSKRTYLKISDDKQYVIGTTQLVSKKYGNTIIINDNGYLAENSIKNLDDGYYYICEGIIVNISVTKNNDIIIINIEIQDTVITQDNGI